MLSTEEAKKIGLRACIDKLGYSFCKKYEDTIVYAYGEEDGLVECYVGVDNRPDKFDEETRVLILDDTKMSPYYARCNVSRADGTITFLEECIPMNWTKTYKKAVTFSYDDGVTPDLKLLEIFNKYGIKCTFNLNYGLGPSKGGWEYMGKPVNRLDLAENVEKYAGHEIAAHALTHPDLTKLPLEEARREMAEDKEGLTKLFGKCPVGMAYPFGTFNDEVVAMLDELGFKYARTVWSSHNFDVQTDLLRFRPTCHHDDEKLFELAEEFLAMETDEPKIFYVWGHSYEFEGNDNWDRIEKLCQMLSGRDDIFYGTNEEVLL